MESGINQAAVDLLCGELRDEGQGVDARAHEGVPVLGHLQRAQPVLHRAHAAQVRSAAVQQGVRGRPAVTGRTDIYKYIYIYIYIYIYLYIILIFIGS